MQIDLNGMTFHLNIFDVAGAPEYRAEIVDEAFSFDVARAWISDLDSAARFVKDYAGIRPRTSVLSQIAERLEMLHQIRPLRHPDHLDDQQDLRRQVG